VLLAGSNGATSYCGVRLLSFDDFCVCQGLSEALGPRREKFSPRAEQYTRWLIQVIRWNLAHSTGSPLAASTTTSTATHADIQTVLVRAMQATDQESFFSFEVANAMDVVFYACSSFFTQQQKQITTAFPALAALSQDQLNYIRAVAIARNTFWFVLCVVWCGVVCGGIGGIGGSSTLSLLSFLLSFLL
jgi:hypothetical protein